MNPRISRVLHPPPELGQVDTSLRYTDILFGFVIKELFVRIQNWAQLDATVRWHLIVGAILVLGSWIGFRRSLNRPRYEVKFFNIPLFTFIVDQAMLILYFRMAVLTTVEGKELPLPDSLARTTSLLVVYVFILYVAWDLLGVLRVKAPLIHKGTWMPIYPKVDLPTNKVTADAQPADWKGFLISVGGLAGLVVLWLIGDCLNPSWLFFWIASLLLGYRWAKEIRTSWRS